MRSRRFRAEDDAGQTIFLGRQLPLEDRAAAEPGLAAGGSAQQIGRRHMESQGMARRIDAPAGEVEAPMPHQHEAASPQVQTHNLIEEIFAQFPLQLHDDDDRAGRSLLEDPRIDLPGVSAIAGRELTSMEWAAYLPNVPKQALCK